MASVSSNQPYIYSFNEIKETIPLSPKGKEEVESLEPIRSAGRKSINYKPGLALGIIAMLGSIYLILAAHDVLRGLNSLSHPLKYGLAYGSLVSGALLSAGFYLAKQWNAYQKQKSGLLDPNLFSNEICETTVYFKEMGEYYIHEDEVLFVKSTYDKKFVHCILSKKEGYIKSEDVNSYLAEKGKTALIKSTSLAENMDLKGVKTFLNKVLGKYGPFESLPFIPFPLKRRPHINHFKPKHPLTKAFWLDKNNAYYFILAIKVTSGEKQGVITFSTNDGNWILKGDENVIFHSNMGMGRYNDVAASNLKDLLTNGNLQDDNDTEWKICPD